MTHQKYFATCARGIEPVLAGELRELGAVDVEPGRGGVHFAGDRALLYRANLWLRTAIRVLQPILEAPCPRRKSFTRWCGASIGRSISRRSTRWRWTATSAICSLPFALCRTETKDAICDRSSIAPAAGRAWMSSSRSWG